jgi:DNA-directed RNA polymerase specialized sigma24 family protein
MTEDEMTVGYREHFGRTVAILTRHLGQDAEDVAQKLWLSFFQRVDAIDATRFQHYLNRAMRNATIDEMRRRRFRPTPNDEIQTTDTDCPRSA